MDLPILVGPQFVPADAKLADRVFFSQHRDRQLRIRPPFAGEYLQEFRSLGFHAEDRRRIIVSRIPAGQAKRHNVDFLRVAFLLFADETVEDRDDILRPILHEIMVDARNSLTH